jgi:hypothetical protein
MKRKTLAQFEETHGQSKVAELKQRLEVERRKVEVLADVQHKTTVTKTKGSTILFGLTGDRHVGSLYHAPDALAAYYEYAASCGVRNVYDTGDILSGWKVFKGHEFELRDIGMDAQIERLKSFSVPASITTKFITGNHDASFKNQVGVSVGKVIERECYGYQFLGEDQAKVVYSTPTGDYAIMLLHPGGGSAYALSYKPQKIVESLEGGSKPNLLAIGHFHKAEMMPSYRNVAVFQTGTFEKQTPFMARGGLAAHVAGWIVEVCVGEDHNTIRAEFVAFYK